MYGVFDACTSLANLDVSNWDTSNVTNMATMFKNCDSLTYVPIQNWNMENVDQKDKITMFEGCNSLINKIADFIKAS
ncbi:MULTISPECIES: BspA family leucine-rich repeat surface protein [Enterococcus]|uniref:BspA family leucine-rich repeat surface protein n=1 Tax=Enterococcus TaxID=1350 RepID=UPI001574DEEB|nr:BspA family leucine-rich repeat surface protein [Enterococcus faecium]EME3574950.1 BspA family leucine-rich repeat surface protein [Enterococcus faecium]EME8074863.1 BspA family leucine-rich repeat surface protein [Enterococcus faecium]EMF0339225.1 BspA family leucine-rich repeat surface protein [Enterococcus faecium]EMF0403682.1 BspA family leucine-rich repeat surface protein [Enterococcus faecium]EMF0595049.1 BspA family leucine-rich repeat surface protein [Enterococcus faecium]